MDSPRIPNGIPSEVRGVCLGFSIDFRGTRVDGPHPEDNEDDKKIDDATDAYEDNVEDYELMAYNMQELRRYIREVQEVVVYYRNVTLPNGEEAVGGKIEVKKD